MIRTTKQLQAQLKDGYTIKNYGFRLFLFEGRGLMWRARYKTRRAKIIIGIVSTIYILELLTCIKLGG